MFNCSTGKDVDARSFESTCIYIVHTKLCQTHQKRYVYIYSAHQTVSLISQYHRFLFNVTVLRIPWQIGKLAYVLLVQSMGQDKSRLGITHFAASESCSMLTIADSTDGDHTCLCRCCFERRVS
jgi:hypothetical protein